MPPGIVATDLGFTWPDGQPVLGGVSFALGPGRTGLIGANGGGNLDWLTPFTSLRTDTYARPAECMAACAAARRLTQPAARWCQAQRRGAISALLRGSSSVRMAASAVSRTGRSVSGEC